MCEFTTCRRRCQALAILFWCWQPKLDKWVVGKLTFGDTFFLETFSEFLGKLHFGKTTLSDTQGAYKFNLSTFIDGSAVELSWFLIRNTYMCFYYSGFKFLPEFCIRSFRQTRPPCCTLSRQSSETHIVSLQCDCIYCISYMVWVIYTIFQTVSAEKERVRVVFSWGCLWRL